MVDQWLLLRGLSREQQHWEGFPAVFADRLDTEVVCVDAPGFGTEHKRTSPRTISAITDDIRSRVEFGGDTWSILGISLGGMVALDWCARFPADFERCVVINTSSRASRPWERFNLRSVPTLMTQRFRSGLARERAILALSSNNPGSTELAARWAAYLAMRTPTETSVANQVAAALSFPLPREIQIPLLVLSSRADRVVSYRCSEAIAERLAAPIRLHETAGHDLPLDDAKWICDQVIDWLDAQDQR